MLAILWPLWSSCHSNPDFQHTKFLIDIRNTNQKGFLLENIWCVSYWTLLSTQCVLLRTCAESQLLIDFASECQDFSYFFSKLRLAS